MSYEDNSNYNSNNNTRGKKQYGKLVEPNKSRVQTTFKKETPVSNSADNFSMSFEDKFRSNEASVMEDMKQGEAMVLGSKVNYEEMDKS